MTRTRTLAAFAIAAVLGWAPGVFAQEKPKDDLDRLLENLEKKEKEKDKAPAPKDDKTSDPKGKEQASKDKKPENPKPQEPKDKDLDSLLEKLGGTTDTPDTKNDRKPPVAGGAPKPGEPKDAKLKDEQKDLDQVLEERAGVIKKKKQQQQQASDPRLAEAIKQMREVEQKLSKGESGEKTREEQQEIVKKLETMIKQMRQGQGQGRGQQRRMAQAGQKPGDQQGQPGSNPANDPKGVGPQKPARPTHKDVLGMGDDKNPWGNLPATMREELANVFKEQALKAKESLINRYFLTVSKKSTAAKGD